MSLLHTRTFSSWARGHLLCRAEGVADRFALTFDDGPNGRATPALLDLLARHGAHATFFMLAPNLVRHPTLARRLVEAGHEAALHGDRHWPLPMLAPWAIRGEIEVCALALAAAAGVRARHYRPPFGFMMPGQSAFVRSLGYESVLGDVYPEDPRERDARKLVERVQARLTAGSILILHDGSPLGDVDRSPTLEALETILRHAAGRGWRAVTVAELVDARPGPPARNGQAAGAAVRSVTE